MSIANSIRRAAGARNPWQALSAVETRIVDAMLPIFNSALDLSTDDKRTLFLLVAEALDGGAGRGGAE